MNEKQQRFYQWWQSPLGQLLTEVERNMMSRLQGTFQGYFQVQLGGANNILPPTVRLTCQSHIAPEGELIATAEALPFKSHSVDHLVLMHVLDYTDNPHQVLRETERVLVTDGEVILTVFHPFSWWGVRRLFSWQDTAPWEGRFFTTQRIKDWLALLNFEVTEQHKVFFRPPFKRQNWLQNSRFVERWGKRLWPYFGAVTIMVAKKRTIPVTRIRQQRQPRQLFPRPRLINKPITRNKP